MTQYDVGGLTIAPNFIMEARLSNAPATLLSPSSQAAIITGEDGVRYFVSGDDSSSVTSALIVRDADTGTIIFQPTNASIRADAEAAGIAPPTGWIGIGMNVAFGLAIAETPYIVVFVSSAAAIDVDRGVLWYKINAASALELVGGYAGERNGTGVQFSPGSASCVGYGFLPNNGFSGPGSTIPYVYPLVVGYSGENRSTLLVLPPINQIIAQTPITENVPKTPGSWIGKELRLGDVGLDASAFLTRDLAPNKSATFQRSRMSVLPRASGSSFAAIMWYTSDLEAYAAGTEIVANAFLSANAGANVDGLISAVDVSATPDLSIFGFTSALGSVTTSFNSVLKTSSGAAAFPFSDDKETFAGAPAAADDAYYGNPSVYPSNIDDPDEPWFVFYPKIDRVTLDEVGVRIFQWDPMTEELKLLDFGFGQVFTLGVDVAATTKVFAASVNWDRITGTVTLLMRSTESGFDSWIVSDLGTFDPVVLTATTGNNDPEAFRLRAWAFELDGHEMYVLRLGQFGTFIYDRTTQQWSEWNTGSDVNWDASVGGNWNDYVIAGALEDPYLWSISPEQSLDNVGVVDGDIPITRTVTGLVSLRGRGRQRCGAVRVTASVGATDIPSAQMSLSFSDDYGVTYSSPTTIQMSATDTYQDLSFRSIGSMRAPGRVFRITDIGGATRIDDAVIEVS